MARVIAVGSEEGERSFCDSEACSFLESTPPGEPGPSSVHGPFGAASLRGFEGAVSTARFRLLTTPNGRRIVSADRLVFEVKFTSNERNT